MASSSISPHCTRCTIPSKDDRPCVCSICTCGNHHCPGKLEHAPMASETAYREQYKGYEITGPPVRVGDVLRKMRREQLQLSHESPEHYQTTSKTNFASTIIGGGNSSSSEVYAKIVKDCRPNSYKPKERRIFTAKFDGGTSNGVFFNEDHHKKARPAQRALQRNVSPIVGADFGALGSYTTTNKEFDEGFRSALASTTPLSVCRQPSCKPRTELNLDKGAKFIETSSYADQYKPVPIDPTPRRSRKTKVVVPQDKLPPEDARDFKSTAQNDLEQNALSISRARSERATPLGGRCPAAYAPRRPPSDDGHIHIKATVKP